jgi:DNA-binding NarL/FixJ family response regulator
MAEARARGLRVVEGGSSVHSDRSGLQFVEELRKADRRVVVLVLRISLHPDDHCRALELGADAVLSKAAALDDITDAIRQLRLSSDPESVVGEKQG